MFLELVCFLFIVKSGAGVIVPLSLPSGPPFCLAHVIFFFFLPQVPFSHSPGSRSPFSSLSFFFFLESSAHSFAALWFLSCVLFPSTLTLVFPSFPFFSLLRFFLSIFLQGRSSPSRVVFFSTSTPGLFFGNFSFFLIFLLFLFFFFSLSFFLFFCLFFIFFYHFFFLSSFFSFLGFFSDLALVVVGFSLFPCGALCGVFLSGGRLTSAEPRL